MSNDEEDDYMSDAFLQQLQQSSNGSSLLFSRREQYAHKQFKKKVETRQKSKKELAQLEVEKRNEAMQKPINSGNKGFMLLQKMMAKSQPEDTKDDSKSDNNKKTDLTTLMSERQPIQIDFKNDRKGVGHQKTVPMVLKRKQVSEEHLAMTEEEFRLSKRSKSDLFYAKKDLFSCQRSCVTLDQGKDILVPKEEWFWPPEHREKKKEDKEDEDEDHEDLNAEIKEEEDEEEEEEEVNFVKRLTSLVSYLRQEYYYCNWCGIRYDSTEDLEQHCPGDTREQHID